MEHFVRYVQDGVAELEQRLSEQPELKQQIEEVIRESLTRTTMEALEIEQSVSILAGDDIARAVIACIRCLESYDDLEELGNQADLGPETVGFLRYLTARYGPVLKSFRRRIHHPHGWHKFGHSVTQLETGQTQLQLKIMRNDDAVLLLEDDTDSILRLVNLMLKSLESADDYANLDAGTVQELTERYTHLIDRATQCNGPLDRTEH
ncbi:hypothetical protein [Tumebacillus flagellatus]|uniref:Uncharacterized protein n=1 Tax=Tumebacillus flagellatus TaxID=1157490 RepID=A0A074M6N5_9BACL|nr:hypothetical protein [Tumebacillus flagellatus]KEO81632.1 hypothetical protein EL26_19855 [Tumebacillus flagellatus]